MKSRTIGRTLLLAALLQLAACNTIIQQPAPSQIYTLRPLPTLESGVQPLPVNLIVSRPLVSPGLERELIALLKPDNQLSYYAQSRWTAPTAELVRYFLIDSLQNQNLFQSVTPDSRFLRNNYRLDVHVQDFQADYSGKAKSPQVQLRLAFTLTNLATRNAVASFVETLEEPVQENRLSQVVAAFQKGISRATESAIRKIRQGVEFEARKEAKNE